MIRVAFLVLLVGADGFAADEWPSPVTWKPDERALSSEIYIQPHAAAKRERVEFTVGDPAGIARKQWPVRGSVPLYRGELKDAKNIRLLDASGKEVLVQGKATGFWPEKTIRFLCLDFLADLDAGQEKKFVLEYGSEVKSTLPALVKSAAEPDKAIAIDTGKATFVLKSGTEFMQVTVAEPRLALKPITGEAVVCADEKGSAPARKPLTIDEVALAEQGAVQCTIHLTGHYGVERSGPAGDKNEETWRYPVSLWLRFYGGTGHVYVEHCFGYNGDEYKDFVQSYGLTIPTGLSKGQFHYGPSEGESAESALGVRLNQFAHNEWTLSGKATANGKRFGGWGAIQDGKSQIVVGMREAWQNWPVAIRAGENGDLAYEILGEKNERALDLRYEDRASGQGKFHKSHSMYIGETLSWEYFSDSVGSIGANARGLMKIHELFLDFAPAAPGAEIAKGFQKPLVPWPGQNRFADSKTFGHIGVYGDPKYDYAKDHFSVLLDGWPLIHEANGLYGWVDWGDQPMFHEVKDGKMVCFMEGGIGWANGERAVQSYFYHYIAGGGRRFLDLGRAFVHHTIGIDTEHAGGDTWRGGYLRHNQAHWRCGGATRQGGYRGWHAYYWLTGDPEVGRLAILEGIDAPGNSVFMNVRADAPTANVGSDEQHTADYMVAYLSWITTGDWRYVRAHHAIAKVWDMALTQGKGVLNGWNFFQVGADGEPSGYQLVERGGGMGAGYWYTYGGDDLLVDWSALTGDPVAVDALVRFSRAHGGPSQMLYHSPEALYVGSAFLTHDARLPTFLAARNWPSPNGSAFATNRLVYPYASLQQWFDLGGKNMYGKNGFSICAAQAVEFLYWMKAAELVAAYPTATIKLPPLARVEAGKKTVDVKLDGSSSQAKEGAPSKYEWFLQGKPCGTGSQITVPMPTGVNSVTLKVTDAKGNYGEAIADVRVWDSNVICKLAFFGGPPDYLEAHRAFDAQAGFGWVTPLADADSSYGAHDQARGCGAFAIMRPGHKYQIAAAPGTYHIEMGAAVTWMSSHMPVSLQGKVVVPGKKVDGNGISWNYAGDAVVGDDGFITITLDSYVDENGAAVIDGHGNTGIGIISYIEVTKS